MAQTTGQISAKDTKIELATTDISGSSNTVSLEPERAIGRAATFDGDYLLKVAGKIDWKGKIRAIYTETTDEATNVAYTAFESGAATALTVSPGGGGVGDWEWSGNIIITKAPIVLDSSSEDPVLMEFEFEGTGALTKAAVST